MQPLRFAHDVHLMQRRDKCPDIAVGSPALGLQQEECQGLNCEYPMQEAVGHKYLLSLVCAQAQATYICHPCPSAHPVAELTTLQGPIPSSLRFSLVILHQRHFSLWVKWC